MQSGGGIINKKHDRYRTNNNKVAFVANRLNCYSYSDNNYHRFGADFNDE